jgi:hypothetical protein
MSMVITQVIITQKQESSPDSGAWLPDKSQGPAKAFAFFEDFHDRM